jgi:hypothetical protein
MFLSMTDEIWAFWAFQVLDGMALNDVIHNQIMTIQQ